nr:AAA family ATPase [uncultured Cohaesibacter sp.]
MKIVACYSNKGGVGKTATSVNLAYALADKGKRVLLCDLDPQGASSFYFRVKPSKKLTDERFFRDEDRFVRAIRGSNYDNLDILPANMSFRNFDVFLSRMKNSRSRLKKALKAVKKDYDVILLDCPPNISTLSESVFKAADVVLVPVIPTTLSQRTFEQLVDFFRENKIPLKKLAAFFSMVQNVKSLHSEMMDELSGKYKRQFLAAQVPFTSDIERMGVHRAPVLASAPASAASKAYRDLFKDVSKKVSLK